MAIEPNPNPAPHQMIQLTNDYESLVFNGDIGRVTAVRPGRGARFTVCFDQREALTRGSSDEAAGAKPNPSPSPDPDPNPNPNPSPNPNPNPSLTRRRVVVWRWSTVPRRWGVTWL